ncbi:NAD-binding protein [Variovorax sp. LjRoot178]|uniref:NAD-binding protein n=1 Tax=Variovorax sp. LjRoot178 TaxID=3342277 RepID=UPI003ECDC399
MSRLRGAFHVKQVADVTSLEKIAPDCDVLVLGAGAGQDFGDQAANWTRATFGRIATVIDQRVVDPERTREFAVALQRSGVALVDAPIHCEKVEEFPQLAATLCGSSHDAFASVKPLLEAMGAKVIHFGASGTGHAARLLVGAAATCNRMATCEGAAAGFANGLSIADMAMVLNRSSGVNSGTERVLPHLGTGGRTTEMPLADVAEEMRLVSQLAMRAGAPLLLANVVGELCRSLANGLADGATFDDAVALMEKAAGLRYGAR